jgi:hypothetical protein
VFHFWYRVKLGHVIVNLIGLDLLLVNKSGFSLYRIRNIRKSRARCIEEIVGISMWYISHSMS